MTKNNISFHSCLVLSCLVLSCLVLSFLIISYLVLEYGGHFSCDLVRKSNFFLFKLMNYTQQLSELQDGMLYRLSTACHCASKNPLFLSAIYVVFLTSICAKHSTNRGCHHALLRCRKGPCTKTTNRKTLDSGMRWGPRTPGLILLSLIHFLLIITCDQFKL